MLQEERHRSQDDNEWRGRDKMTTSWTMEQQTVTTDTVLYQRYDTLALDLDAKARLGLWALARG